MNPAVYDLTIYQGDTFKLPFRLRDSVTRAFLDLTGVTVAAEIRTATSANTALAVFTGVVQDQSTTPGGVLLSLTAGATATLSPTLNTTTNKNTPYVWDVQLIWPDGSIETYLRGSVTVTAQVTR